MCRNRNDRLVISFLYNLLVMSFLTKIYRCKEPAQNEVWSRYFLLKEQRKLRRRLFTGLGLPIGFFTSAQYVGNLVFKPSELILGLDPMIVMSAGVLMSSFATALVMPSLGEALWLRIKKDEGIFLTEMDKDFYASISKYRSNPSPDNSISFSTKQSPLMTDFYGEKIQNVDQYLQWKSLHEKLRQNQNEEEDKDDKTININKK
eukprot:NODE_17_length_48642_cov_1.199349.p28 type:complete len:204 gc:universal NODE_17_length_48642_cov_1.199349:11688-11077(-)